MKLHMDIDCASLDDLKSARATIDRLIQDHETRSCKTNVIQTHEEKQQAAATAARKILSGQVVLGEELVKELRRIANPPLRDDRRGGDIDIVTDDATGDEFTFEQLDKVVPCLQCGMKWTVRGWRTQTKPYVCRCGFNMQREYVETDKPPERKEYPCGDEWQCSCGKVNAGKSARCSRCGL